MGVDNETQVDTKPTLLIEGHVRRFSTHAKPSVESHLLDLPRC